jgi:muramoyltetrapeptide carboxypeptidase LdcA involved in peptidoglycan recycling
VKEYKSVQAWFKAKQYKERTKSTYLQYMATFCGLLNKTPDQLASVNSREAWEIQVQLAEAMKEELQLRDLSITQRLNALHSFWRANNVQLTDAVMTYDGLPSLQRLVKAPES